MNGNKQKLDALIDWVQVTFKELDYLKVMEYILQFDKVAYENRGWSFCERTTLGNYCFDRRTHTEKICLIESALNSTAS